MGEIARHVESEDETMLRVICIAVADDAAEVGRIVELYVAEYRDVSDTVVAASGSPVTAALAVPR